MRRSLATFCTGASLLCVYLCEGEEEVWGGQEEGLVKMGC